MDPIGPQRRGLCDLFGRAEVKAFIDHVAEADCLSVVAGAGTSIESGFPDWTRLVTRLLTRVALERGLEGGAVDEFAGWTLQREGLTAAAAVAEACLGASFSSELHAALYGQQLTPPPGQSAIAIAQLVETLGVDGCDVATTNYDLVLEHAIEMVTGQSSTVATQAGRGPGNRVLHLHGVVTPRGRIRGELVLSERDYFLMQEDSAWQQTYFSERLSSSTCVFVGASLTDPNILRYLYRTETAGQHFALFSRQQDAGLYDEAESSVVLLREETSELRWRRAGIQPIHTDFFSQSAQLLHEALHRRRTAQRRRVYHPLPKRLARWRKRLEDGALTVRPGPFRSAQLDLQEMMEDLLAGLKLDLSDAGHRPGSGERLGISLWVYDPRNETLTNWASADRVWRDPRTMEPLPVDWRSDFVSVQAFCAGSLVSRSTEQHVATRWNHVIGAPLYVDADGGGRLPAGAVTIASTRSAPSSVLDRGLGTLRRVSLPTIETVLAELLRT
jgi:hypothetical protein